MNARPSRFDRRRPDKGHRINQRIRAPEVRVIHEGDQLGIMPTPQALRLAEDRGLDLVEISPGASPPVCRIMDYGKFKYEEAKKKQQQKKATSTFETKEIKFRPKTEEHDMDFKVKHVRRFLEEGHRVRLIVMFRGREMVHPQTGRAVLDRAVQRCEDLSSMEASPSLEGRSMSLVLAPKPSVVQRAIALKKEQARAQAAAQAAAREAKTAQDDDLDEDAINADVDADPSGD